MVGPISCRMEYTSSNTLCVSGGAAESGGRRQLHLRAGGATGDAGLREGPCFTRYPLVCRNLLLLDDILNEHLTVSVQVVLCGIVWYSINHKIMCIT